MLREQYGNIVKLHTSEINFQKTLWINIKLIVLFIQTFEEELHEVVSDCLIGFKFGLITRKKQYDRKFII